ncbi:MAG: hypothetical protein GY862_30840, partial [Gammaproteobacteria bacterium]|nr:hypothetical protein [Gammaproteobacteria bacterium]
LFDECFIDSDGQENYISRLNASWHWVLDDHRIMGGKAVLPGTACLELARAAFATHAQAGVIEIRDVYFLRPLTVEDKECKEVHTRLSKRLTVRAPLPARFRSHVKEVGAQTAQPSGTRQFNVTLMDERGVELVDIEEYTLLRAAGLPTEAPVGVCNPDRNVCGDSKRYGAGYKPAPADEVPGDEVPVGVLPQAQGEKAAFPEENRNVHLEIASPGLLDSLAFRPSERRPPG